ncbi:MAG: hydantoinase B/oxoprolinase family protein, partial [Actinomycetota bacterium]|nr:hydantoinase B/oxoprolinase family protein [Actinomycetota bacterium]
MTATSTRAARKRRAARAVDPITFELASAALQAAAIEMGGVLKHSSYSPIIREMDDFSCAIFRADGDLVAQADFIPAQLGAMSLVVRAIIDRWGSAVAPGDAYLANHPYLGAMHTPDLNVIMPVFHGGALFGWVGTAAHHIDVGGVRPGTEGPDLTEVYAEGLLLPPVRLYRGGEENPDVFALVGAAVRDPV